MWHRPSILLSLFFAGCAFRGGAGASPSASPTLWEPPRIEAERRARFEKIIPELDKVLAEDQRVSRAPGIAIGIVVGGETVYAKGFGLRDVAQKKPFTADTPFPIASVTKSFTAMAILKLRDEGKLDLDGPAARYYPPLAKLAYPTRDAPPVTLRHLLTHSSGMPEDNPWADVTENMTDAELTHLLDGGVMSRASGLQFEYANVGYGVLGRVIERVSGVPTREYIRRAILEPLGMTHSGWQPDDFPAGTVAVGYRGREGSRDMDAPAVIAPAERLGVMDAAGGLYTTVQDLSRYVAFHLAAWPARDDPDTGPLRRSSVREMQQGVRSTNYGDFLPRLTQRAPPATARIGVDGLALHALAYGFGLQAHTTCEGAFVEHSGGLPGYVTFLTMVPEMGAGVVLFINDERARTKGVELAVKLLRTAGLLVATRVPPLPALTDALTGVNELLSSWDDAKARALFEPSFFRYQTMETLKERFLAFKRDHGTCRLEGEPTVVNRLRASWRVACEHGAIQFAAGLAPGPKPRLQGLEQREDMPPGAALEHAGGVMTEMLAHWDTNVVARELASSADAAKIERAVAKLAATHGACKLDRAVESDGKTRAIFALSCKERPLELTVVLDPHGKIASVAGHPPRSEAMPNCAE